ncbi:MAG: glycosyl hydrolase family 18 protein [Clostridia bacterium]|nr:glycosyl hydrolase family 18 protein [Clostridia bacterium]
MFNYVKRCIVPFIFLLIVLVVFYTFNISKNNGEKKEADLVIYGDNIETNYKPFKQDDGIYISVDTISKVIDSNIFYDKVATKVIITTKDDVVKFKIDENLMSKNMEYISINTSAKLVNGQPFVDVELLKDIYNIKIEYNEETNTISIDKKSSTDVPIAYDKVNVYADISTKSEVLQTINRNNTVTLYNESLNHNRWYKVKTDSGVIGYIAKLNIDESYVKAQEEKQENEKNEEENVLVENQEKLIMFWQYGSDLTTLGEEKIDGVNVVSPTWYELKNPTGEITSKFSQEYYNRAKEYGYEIWPIITNGIDSSSYSPDDTSQMLNSERNRENFIKNLVSIAKDNKIDGINIDFEAMKDDDRDLFTQFIRELAPILRKNHIKLSVDMYFVKYIDRTRVGEAADYVVLMGYDQRGAWSSEAGSIAEASWVEKNINSLINDSKISSSKIILGVPFYTRLWTEKSGDDNIGTKIYTMKDCQNFIERNEITTIWDEDAGQNYAEYVLNDTTYKLWIEDADSIKRRTEIVNKYNLVGITGWRKGFETNDIWQVIRDELKK